MGTPPPPFTPPPPASSPWPPPSTPSNPPGRRVPRAAWWVVGGLTALLTFGAALAPDDDSPTVRAASTAPAAPSATVDEDVVLESVAIRMIAAQVNPDIGVAYSTNPAGTAKVFADVGDKACEAAARFGDGMAFAAGMVSVWGTFDSETQEFYGGSTDTWAALVGILLGWRCPNQPDRLLS